MALEVFFLNFICIFINPYFFVMKKKAFLLFFLFTNLIYSQDAWVQINDFLFETRIKTSFSTEDKGYILLHNNNNSIVEFYSFDPILDSYEQLADFPLQLNTHYTSFVIDNDGYVILQDDSTQDADILLYKYDEAQNSWEQKTGTTFNNFGINSILGTGFSINNKGYFATTWGDPEDNFKEYDPNTDSWTSKPNYPGPGGLGYDLDFTIGDIGYLAYAFDDFDIYPVLWSYNQNTENWTQLADIPFLNASARASFAIGDQGYIGMFPGFGAPTFFRYTPSSNNWEQIESCGYASGQCFSYSIGNYAYVGAGFHLDPEKQVWRLDPELLDFNDFETSKIKIFPNPVKETLNVNGLLPNTSYTLYDISGRVISKGNLLEQKIPVSHLSNGTYIIKFISNTNNAYYKSIIKE